MDRSPSRRRFLLTGGVALGAFAGCLTTSEDAVPSETSRSTPVDRPTNAPTTEPAPTGTLSVADTGTRSWVVAPNFPDSLDVFGERGRQYLFFGIAVEGTAPVDYTAFGLTADDTQYTPTEYIGIADTAGTSTGYGDRYTREAGGWVAFHVPEPLDADSVTLRWPEDGRYVVGDDLLAELATPPAEFAVREFAETASSDGTRTVALTVENTGDVDGRFVALVAWYEPRADYGESVELSLDVAAGDTETWSRTYTVGSGGAEALTVYLRWSGEERSVELSLDAKRATEESVQDSSRLSTTRSDPPQPPQR